MTLSSNPALVSLWIVVMLAQGYVLALLVGREAYRQYPAFTAFVAFCVVRSSLLFYLAHHATPLLFDKVVWVAYAPQLVLLIMLVLEVFRIVFHPYDTLPKGTLAHFVEATVAVAAVMVAFAIRYPGSQPTAWMTFARAMDQATAWVLTAIFAFIAIFSSYFGIPWRHRVYGIGIGFLFYLCVDVAVTTVVAQYGFAASRLIWPLDMLAFVVACLIWAYYFSTVETPRSVPTLEQLENVHSILNRIAVSLDPQWADRDERPKKRTDGSAESPAEADEQRVHP